MISQDSEYYYRIDSHGSMPYGVPEVSLRVDRYRVIKRTKCGVWLDVWDKKRFVLSGSLKQFACPTLKEAKKSFLARREKQIKILTVQLACAKEAINIINGRPSTDLNAFWGQTMGMSGISLDELVSA